MKTLCVALLILAIGGGAVASVLASDLPDALERLTESLPRAGSILRAPLAEIPGPIAGMLGVAVTLAMVTAGARLIVGSAGATRPLDPRIKIGIALCFAAVVSTVSAPEVWKLAALGLSVLVTTLALRLPPRRLWALVPVAALVLFTAATWIAVDPATGWTHAPVLVAKVLLSALALVLLVHTTPSTDLSRGLRGLGLPSVLVLSMALLERSIAALGEEARRLKLAGRARGARSSARLAGAALASLFGRTLDRSDRVRLAMQARGFDIEHAPRPAFRLDGADALFAGSLALLLGLTAWL